MASTSAAQSPQLVDYRNKVNLKSLTRSDPHITAILETSAYSVIYEYDDAVESWEKQKQEGPLFIVRRDCVPEYSLYMLNRQSVKNVAIPLTPGEVKLTTVNYDILQVARRGERQRRGVWFHGGAEALETFRKAIYEICGEPRKPPSSQSPFSTSPAAAPPNPQPQSSAAEVDGLARLFAPLLKVPPADPVAPVSPSPSFPSPSPQLQVPVTGSPHPPSIVPVPPADPPADPPPATSPTPAHSASAPSLFQASFTPGETVHDLLHSILGVNPFSSPAAVPSQQIPSPGPAPPPGQQSTLLTSTSMQLPASSTQYTSSSSNTHGPSLAEPVSPPAKASMPWAKIGDASFAQAVGGRTEEKPVIITPTGADASFSNVDGQVTDGGRTGGQVNQPRRKSLPKKAGGQFDDRAAKADTLVGGVMARPKQFGKVPISMINDTAKKLQFKQSLLELIHSDPSFVDELWVGYLTRREQVSA